jgi:hypothetical protein
MKERTKEKRELYVCAVRRVKITTFLLLLLSPISFCIERVYTYLYMYYPTPFVICLQ